MDAKQVLEAFERELEKREDWWRDCRHDPHGIATAMMVALGEVRQAIRAAIDSLSVDDLKEDG